MNHTELKVGDLIDVRKGSKWYVVHFVEVVEIVEGLPSIFGKNTDGIFVFYNKVEEIRLHIKSAEVA